MSEHNIERSLNSITRETLAPLVSTSLGVDSVQIVDWDYEALHGGIGEVYENGLFRFRGRATMDNQVRQWMLILKIIRSDIEYYSNEPSAWNYWKREALAYQDGLLDDLPGQLAAPRCFGVQYISEIEVWIWLQAIPAESPVDWPLSRYGVAARHLGQFNGVYLSGRSMPSHSWLSHGRVEEWLVEASVVIPRLHDFLGHPLVNTWFANDNADRTSRIWSRRQELLDGIAKLPRTLCHHDAFRRNLSAATDQRNQEITFAVDWAVLGAGVIGEEIATTFSVSLQFLDCGAQFAPQLDALIYEGYLAGLHDADWRGQPELARFGFTASAVLFMGLGGAGGWLPWLIDENEQHEIEGYLGHPIEDIVNQWSTMQAYLLDLGDEALTLLEDIE